MIFDSYFAQAIFTVTAAGLILGKEELIYLARMSGKPLGRIMGSFQGMRMRYDLKMQENDLHKASRNVAEGLRHISSISNDFNMIKYGSNITHNPSEVSNSTPGLQHNTYNYNETTNDMIMEKERIAKMFKASKRQVEAEAQQPTPPSPARSRGRFK